MTIPYVAVRTSKKLKRLEFLFRLEAYNDRKVAIYNMVLKRVGRRLYFCLRENLVANSRPHGDFLAFIDDGSNLREIALQLLAEYAYPQFNGIYEWS